MPAKCGARRRRAQRAAVAAGPDSILESPFGLSSAPGPGASPRRIRPCPSARSPPRDGTSRPSRARRGGGPAPSRPVPPRRIGRDAPSVLVEHAAGAPLRDAAKRGASPHGRLTDSRHRRPPRACRELAGIPSHPARARTPRNDFCRPARLPPPWRAPAARHARGANRGTGAGTRQRHMAPTGSQAQVRTPARESRPARPVFTPGSRNRRAVRLPPTAPGRPSGDPGSRVLPPVRGSSGVAGLRPDGGHAAPGPRRRRRPRSRGDAQPRRGTRPLPFRPGAAARPRGATPGRRPPPGAGCAWR